MITSYDPNERMEIVRNPYFKEWSADAQPDGFADEIHYDFGPTEEARSPRSRTVRPTGCLTRRRPTVW